jgi:hypothetical protein
MRTGLLSDLSVIGYQIFLEGETIRLRYQKPDTPPESARQLIDELRKFKTEAVNILKTDNALPPREIIQPEPILEIVWSNPHKKGTPEARRQSLEDVIYATILDAHARIIKARQGQPYVATDEIRKAEQDINKLQHEIMNGQAMLSDYQTACDRWVSMMIKAERRQHDRQKPIETH